jgi:two-component system sensor histidine kinase ChiS
MSQALATMKFSLASTRARIVLFFGAFLLALFSGLFVQTPPSLSQSPPSINSKPIELTQGWQYRWGESPVDIEGVPTWIQEDTLDSQWQSFKVPGKLSVPPGEKFIWLRVPLPDGLWPYPSLYIRGIPYLLNTYLDSQLIYIFYDLEPSGAAEIRDEKWPIVPLEPGFEGKTLFFKAYAANDPTLAIGLFNQVTIGAQPDLIKNLIIKDIDRVIFGFFFVFIGLFPILVSLRGKLQKLYLSFAFLAIVVGVYTIARTEIIPLTFNKFLFWKYIEYASFYLIPAGVCAFFEQIFGRGYKSIVYRLLQIHLGFALMAFLLAGTRIVPWNYTIYPNHILTIVSATTLIVLAIGKSFKGDIEAKLFTLGFAAFCLSAIHDILAYVFYIFPWHVELYYWGMFVFVGFLGIILERRFTEARKRLHAYAAEMEEKNAALQQIDKLKDEFLANTSHELRTPLNGIVGIAESVIDGATGKLPKATVLNLSMIVSSGRRLTQLVNDLLDFSQLNHKNIELQTKPIGMREITDVVLILSIPLIGKKSLQVINNIAPDIPAVNADENRVQQILHNLVSNAIKFTESGTIEVSAQVINDYLEVAVSDTGIGISEDKLTCIFESFEQADGSIAREYGGAGLGLSITRQLVQLHGGTIRVNSTIGKGSQFIFTLPIYQGEASPTFNLKQLLPQASKLKDLMETFINPDDNNQEQLDLPTPTQGEFKILIVDDEPVNLQVLFNHLSLQKYAITQATNGVEAIDIIDKGFQPDLVLLDVMMPKMTGYEVCRIIRQHFPAHELPIVLLTAKDQVSDLVEGFGAGANDYLTKPFSKSELFARIKTHIRLSKIHLASSRFVPYEFLRFLGKESIVDVQLGDQIQKEMSILFSDIRTFTTLSESMSPKENFDFLNAYLKRVGPVIRNHNGFIDKYIGDAIMAIFPNTADEALQAAIEMQKQVTLFNVERMDDGNPAIAIGIGLHTGTLMLGTIGEEQRMESTVIADAVNLASRLEDLTKVYGAGIVISEQTLSQLADSHQYNYRFLGRVRVKGKTTAVSVFEVYDGDSDEVQRLKNQTHFEFEQGVSLYHQKKFVQAQEIFQQLLLKNEQDRAARLYIEYCKKSQTTRISEVGQEFEPLGWQES